jgi:gamma-glutamyltranspeptidase/glutathione hydrolase/leukotriene-C4 hydrolase
MLTSAEFADHLRHQIDPDMTHDTSYYTSQSVELRDDNGTSHLSVLGPDGDAVSLTTSLSYQ